MFERTRVLTRIVDSLRISPLQQNGFGESPSINQRNGSSDFSCRRFSGLATLNFIKTHLHKCLERQQIHAYLKTLIQQQQ